MSMTRGPFSSSTLRVRPNHDSLHREFRRKNRGERLGHRECGFAERNRDDLAEGTEIYVGACGADQRAAPVKSALERAALTEG